MNLPLLLAGLPKGCLFIIHDMITIIRTNSKNKDFLKLVKNLDTDLAMRDGEEHAFYSRFNKVDRINHVIIAYVDGIAMGCGAIKKMAPKTMEIKRMYVMPNARAKGLATKILSELEEWAMELAFESCILETGKRQPEAIRLYKKNGYKSIANYGPYIGVDNSLCFKKEFIIDSED